MVASKRDIVLIAHNLRSCHNVGSLLRTAEGLGVKKVFLTGYTPHPILDSDSRLPHIANKIHAQIKKTALGAEELIEWVFNPDIFRVIDDLQKDQYIVYGLEQTPGAIDISTWNPDSKTAIIIGRETKGIEPEVLTKCDKHIEIPMFGKKESFNVVQAAAMALYHSQFYKSC
ncbi:MAG: TrmH family RNA methyltransferase [Patescibacteria group bacterium]